MTQEGEWGGCSQLSSNAMWGDKDNMDLTSGSESKKESEIIMNIVCVCVYLTHEILLKG